MADHKTPSWTFLDTLTLCISVASTGLFAAAFATTGWVQITDVTGQQVYYGLWTDQHSDVSSDTVIMVRSLAMLAFVPSLMCLGPPAVTIVIPWIRSCQSPTMIHTVLHATSGLLVILFQTVYSASMWGQLTAITHEDPSLCGWTYSYSSGLSLMSSMLHIISSTLAFLQLTTRKLHTQCRSQLQKSQPVEISTVDKSTMIISHGDIRL